MNKKMFLTLFCLFLGLSTVNAQVTETQLLASDAQISDFFGTALDISGEQIIVGAYYDDDNGLDSGSAYVGQLPMLRKKLSSLSEFVREIKINFTRFYNKRNGRRGYFWGDRFKSLIVEKTDKEPVPYFTVTDLRHRLQS